MINNCVKSNQLLLSPILEKKGMLTLSTKGEHKNLKSYAKTKVNRISTGQITHSIENIDFGLEI